MASTAGHGTCTARGARRSSAIQKRSSVAAAVFVLCARYSCFRAFAVLPGFAASESGRPLRSAPVGAWRGKAARRALPLPVAEAWSRCPGCSPATAAVASQGVSDGAQQKKARSIGSFGGSIVERFYAEINRRDAGAAADCLADNVVYEDMLLEGSSQVESRDDFRQLIQSHPIFLHRRTCELVGLATPDIRIAVDSISEDLACHTVSVEWHIEVEGNPLGLGRGISFFHVCPETGLILRAVDVAEAPWLAMSLLKHPFWNALEDAKNADSQQHFSPQVIMGSRVAAASQSIAIEDVDRKKANSIGKIVEKLYDDFNRCDAQATSACFTEDVVYEDLMLGGSTIVRSREQFHNIIKSHPVFFSHQAFMFAGLKPPDVKIVVDNIAEDLARHTVGVEWHVDVDGSPLGLGRGLSFFHVCPETGLIRSAVDISEAPWRVIGQAVAPVVQVLELVERVALGLVLSPLAVACSVMAVRTMLTLAVSSSPAVTVTHTDFAPGLMDEGSSIQNDRTRAVPYLELPSRLIGLSGARLSRQAS